MYMEKRNVPSKMMQIFFVPNSLKILQLKVKSEFEGLSNVTMYLMTNLVWELNPRLSVHEADTLPTELTRFYIMYFYLFIFMYF